MKVAEVTYRQVIRIEDFLFTKKTHVASVSKFDYLSDLGIGCLVVIPKKVGPSLSSIRPRSQH